LFVGSMLELVELETPRCRRMDSIALLERYPYRTFGRKATFAPIPMRSTHRARNL